ncbi:MAG: glycosyltransferase family 4 protein [Candidatus Omnitrophica bacterium]|nr:glycosyltransferase family 4 protein [Candidatus Omnitrophota bacterium]
MKTPIRVLMVATYFHPIVGGTERQAFALAKGLLKQGHSVTVATCRFPHLGAFEVVDGIPIHRVIRPHARGAVYAMSYLSSLMAFLVRWRRQYDVIHTHFLYLDAAAAGFLRTRLHKPVVAKAACGGTFGDVARWRRVPFGSLFRPALKQVDCIVALSRQVKEELLAYGLQSSRIVQVPNGVETERFRPADRRDVIRRTLGWQGRIVVFVGRLAPQKGLLNLLEAWAQVAPRLSDATLLLIGSGPQEEQLKRLARRLDLERRLRFVGEQADVLPYLQAADLVVLPSLAEGMSNALLEAMACGLPCVASRIGGNVELVTDGENGCLVEPGHPEQLAEAITRLLQDEQARRRFGAEGRHRVERHYAMGRITERYLTLYRDLLNGGGDGAAA